MSVYKEGSYIATPSPILDCMVIFLLFVSEIVITSWKRGKKGLNSFKLKHETLFKVFISMKFAPDGS